MAKKPVAKKPKSGKASPKSSGSASWWSERGKILAKTTESKPKTRAKKTFPRKARKMEKGSRYYCDVCGSEIVCIEESAGEVFCCEEPMCLVF